ncbi:MAG: hypothetical protein ACXU8A_13265, partial [Burkholderiaceae bacterium]
MDASHTYPFSLIMKHPLLCRTMLVSAFFVCACASAGNQKEEALADSVRVALSRAISDSQPPKPQFTDIKERLRYLYWMGEMSIRLKKKLPDFQIRREFLQTTW